MREAVEARNMVLVAEMVTRSAWMREESRGAHYRLDHTYRDDRNGLKNIFLSENAGPMSLRKVPVGFFAVNPQTLSKFGLEGRG